ncbi:MULTISPECIES: hypothetical protein [Mycolicibacterium]|uniref:hypothetical protein n=1 Tax=Mycolicibacterium TaxID=1866885 RepID=UPI001CDBC91C|nr:hypothetical protein [Mycolicibacterium fortuitum]UBV20331.1 hypothetical protein H8Z59_24110 [Mycolicibacterium fortuitum]
MNQLQALRDTIDLAEAHGMPELPDSPIGLQHLRDMLGEVDKANSATPFSASKLGRWLGWAQCALVAADVGVTLDDMKALNMKYAD